MGARHGGRVPTSNDGLVRANLAPFGPASHTALVRTVEHSERATNDPSQNMSPECFFFGSPLSLPVSMLVEESRIFEVCTFRTLHLHQGNLNQSEALSRRDDHCR
jgi:hypothetical protein